MATWTTRVQAPLRMNGEDYRLFAVESIDKVIEIAKSIRSRDRKASQFCGTLGGVLWSVKSHLQKQQEDGHQKKIEGLLNNLERLCSWPRSLQNDTKKGTGRWPTLKALQYPHHREKATECLRNFAANDSNSQSRVQILEKLNKFAGKVSKEETLKAMKAHSSSTVQPTTPKPRSYELDDDVRRLYNALSQYRSCELEDSHGDIITNIRLNGYRSIAFDDATAEFGVLFYDHPHAGECHWQEACIQICHHGSSKAPKIRFFDEETAVAVGSHPQASCDPIPCKKFCSHISGRSEAQLLLSVENGEFVHRKFRDTSRNWISSQQAMPLASLLDQGIKFSDKNKAILALLLAKATYEFYDSDLIEQGLTKDNVRFLFEERSGIHGVFINEPMLLTSYGEPKAGSKDRGAVSAPMIHDMPKILALGILLLELETEKSMETHREESGFHSDGPVNANMDYRVAKNLVDMDHPACILSEISTLSPFGSILPVCINARELERKIEEHLSANKMTSAASVLDLQTALRAAIYREIVQPLESWVSNYPKPDTVKVLYKLAQRSPAVSRSLRVAPQALSLRSPSAPSNDRNTKEEEMRRQSRVWFENYEQLKEVLQPQDNEKGKGYKQVKIAVLDTGIVQEDYSYYRDCEVIREYQDFVNRDKLWAVLDETGHGSTAVGLLVRACPNAMLYVARVLKTNAATSSEVKNVEEAIDWAISHGVHIITMALGFRDDQPRITEAIERARANHILIFAAASNGRNVDPIYFPAKQTDKVFGIFSTNAGIRESRSLNPSPGNRTHSFAIFGEGIELVEEGPLLLGTSYSTSIAAGLAAMLLDFSRQGQSNAEVLDVSRVKEMQGMMAVLRSMVRGERRGEDYECICPWSVLKSEFISTGELPMVEMRRKQREWIRGSMARWLDRMY